MSAPVPSSGPAPARTTAVDRLLDGLEALVVRHRALTSPSAGEQRLHTELIGAEVAQALALAQAELRRPAHLSVVEIPAEPR